MTKLHNKLNKDNLVPEEGQRGLLCSNKESFRCPSSGTSKEISDIDKEAFKVLLEDLARIFINSELEEYDK
jgi:hypothetical protein